jgi:LacI family transcriptional regulator
LIPAGDRIPLLYFATPSLVNRAPNTQIDFNVSTEQLSGWLHAHRPEVILSYGPFIKESLAKLGLSIPKDIAFVETFLETPDGTTAGVHQNCLRVGELAIEILAGQLHQHSFGIPSIPTATLVEGAWCDGASLPARKSCGVVNIIEDAKAVATEPKPAQFFSRSRNFPRKVAV